MHAHDFGVVSPPSPVFRSRLRLTAQAAALLCAASAALPALAQEASPPIPRGNAAPADLERVIVTGTRGQGTKAVDSVSPIAVVSSTELVATGQTNVLDALKRLEPTFNALARGGDFSNIVRSANLRGLGANQTLVLVNGKRRHTTAYISAAGNVAVDLDFIPVSSIERIEILKDGAAAQYGSDAIGGVLNVILKNSDHGGEIATSYAASTRARSTPTGWATGAPARSSSTRASSSTTTAS